MKLQIKKSQPRITLGQRGEMLAMNRLLQEGYEVLDKNFRCPLGEIDLVASRGKRVCFVEVKTRASLRFGTPEEAVGPVKQRKLIRLAEWYLQERKMNHCRVSFLVVSILWEKEQSPEIRIFENAFECAQDF